ncbi:MAG: T9SS type A sorting domain-containing protein, partial [Bacteroidota bacterium]|nr:T9SS type A sorting domain-containing protein [Bacteroidota bacterium]
GGIPVITHVSDITTLQTCANRFNITRTYRATDECGNSATCFQDIFVFDTSVPTLTCPASVTVQCANLVPPVNTQSVTATADNCGGTPVITHVSDVTTNQTCANRFNITRTYRATDECGNSATCAQSIIVFDTSVPTLTCPASVTVQCANLVPPVNTQSVTATGDNCGGIPVITHVSDVTINQTCANRFNITRTYRATDECGNSATCTQTIFVFDNTVPTLTCPAGVTVQCASLVPPVNTQSVTAQSDNCGGVPTITHVSDVTTNQTCTNRFNLTRTYRATDECGNSATCTQSIVVFDNTAPTLTCPAGVTVQCASQVPPVNTQSVTATGDNCGGIPIITHVSDVTTNQTCVNRFNLTRTYRATDDCGNSATCTQIITVFDNTVPTLTCPANLTFQCANQVPAPNTTLVTAADNCGGTVTVNFVSDVTTNQTCVNRFTLTRTYRATDACGNSATCAQTISVFDNTPPTITCPANITVQCANLVPPPTPASVITSDNCGGTVPTVTFVSDVTTNFICINRLTLTRTYRSTDACGNSATCTQVITVFDNTPPVIVFTDPLLIGVPNGGTIEVQCYGQDPEFDIPTFGPGDVMVTDNCTGNVVVTFTQVLIDEGDCDVDGYINLYRLRWIATDACGNSSSATVFMELVDTIPPVILGVPDDITVSCDEVPVAPILSATDECLCACVMLMSQDGPDPGCQNGQVITRTWKATDDCGNMTIEQQFITLVDNEGPVLTIMQPEIQGLPNGTLLEYTCNEGGIPEFFDDLSAESVFSPVVCGGAPDIKLDKTIFKTRNCKFFGYIEQRIYTWTGVDQCGNKTTLTITVHLIDDEAPVISGVPEMACENDPALEEIEATDNCEVAFLTYWDIKIPSPCGDGDAIRRTYEAYDPCGNYVRDTVLLIPDDNIPPVITFTNPILADLEPGEKLTIECNYANGQYTDFGIHDATMTDDCNESLEMFFDERVVVNGVCVDGRIAILILQWTAFDVCGNSSQKIVTADIVDHTPPTLVNFRADVTIGCNDELPELFPADNCGNATATSVDVIIPGDCEFEYDVMRRITVTDACGNILSVEQRVQVGDGSGPIIEGVEEELCDDLSIPEVTAWDPCAEKFVEVTMVQDTLDIPSCREGFAITRTWSATDACGNVSTIVQTIILNDQTAPEVQIPTWSIIRKFVDVNGSLINLSDIGTIEQLDDLNESSITIIDDCDQVVDPVFTVVVTYADNCVIDGYYERRVYTWTGADACGNSVVLTFTVDIYDDVPPVLGGVPMDTSVICSGLPPVPQITADDYAQPVTIVYNETILPGEGADDFLVVRVWTATDPCGNVATAQQTILWIPNTNIDCSIILPQQVECNSHGVVIGSSLGGGIAPFTYLWEVSGECFIQSGQGTPEIEIYVGFTQVDITLTVTDAYGCISVCQATLDCFDPFDLYTNPSPTGTPAIQPETTNPGIISSSSIEYLQQLNLWPNPASGTVNISFEATNNDMVTYNFTNFLGQVVMEDQIEVQKGINSHKIDISNLPDGTYLIQVKTEKEIHTKTLVIIQND